MTDLISIILPIFLLVALGFTARRLSIVSADFIEGLGLFVLNFALPALVLHALLSQDLHETFNWNYVLAYAGGSLVLFGLMFAAFRTARGQSHAAIASLGGVASNSGFVGFPVASLALGAPALTALPLSMLVENVLIIPLALGLAEAGLHGGKPLPILLRETLLRLIKMPLVVAIFAGVVLSALGLSLPAPVATAIGMVADASAASALFVVGGTLAGLQASSLGPDIVWITVAKLVLHPLAVAGGFWLLGGVPAGLFAAGILLAAAPMLTVYPIFGQRFGLGGLASAALVVATAASFVTIAIVLGLLPADAAEAGLTAPSGEGQVHAQFHDEFHVWAVAEETDG